MNHVAPELLPREISLGSNWPISLFVDGERPLLRKTLGKHVGLTCGDGDQVVVQGDGLVQPLPGLVQGVDAVSNTQTISAIFLHSSVC